MSLNLREGENASVDGGLLREDVALLLAPRSIALVGATDRSTGGREIVKNVLVGHASSYAVNPTRAEVAGRRSYPSIAELPQVPDLAMLAVSADRVEAALDEAVALGVRAFVVPGLGADSGRSGPVVAQRLAQRAAEAGAALLGPNCVGYVRPGLASPCVATVPESLARGSVAVVSQSGAISELLIATGPRIGFSAIVATGNELSRDASDVLAYFADHPETRAIGVFLETVRRPEAFVAALARCAEAGKPVVCLKVGRSSAARRTALAHTGAIVGSAGTLSAVLRAFGVIEVDDMHDFIETLEILGAKRWPSGTRIAAVSDSGGECSLLADRAHAAGMSFEPLSDVLVQRLRVEVPLPDWVHVENPLDTAFRDDRPGGDFVDNIYGALVGAFKVLTSSGELDAVVAAVDFSQFRGSYETELASAIIPKIGAATHESGVFGAVVSFGTADPPAAVAALARTHSVPLLRGGGAAMRAIHAVGSWRRVRPVVPSTALERVPRRSWDSGALPEFESSRLLAEYGVPFAPTRRAQSPAEAAAAAEEVGLPVVVKVHGPAHKAHLGGVVLGIETPEGAARAAERLGGDVIVARQIPGGIEVLCGMTRDPDYGPLIAVGLGGRAVEALGLMAVALGPVDPQGALDLVRRAPGLADLADGGAQRAIANVLVSISQLAEDYAEVVECDVNPVILHGDSATAVDALVVIGDVPARTSHPTCS